MNTANILLALQIADILAKRTQSIIEQVRAAHESGEGITNAQLEAIRSGVDVSRANLTAAIDSLGDQLPLNIVNPGDPQN